MARPSTRGTQYLHNVMAVNLVEHDLFEKRFSTRSQWRTSASRLQTFLFFVYMVDRNYPRERGMKLTMCQYKRWEGTTGIGLRLPRILNLNLTSYVQTLGMYIFKYLDPSLDLSMAYLPIRRLWKDTYIYCSTYYCSYVHMYIDYCLVRSHGYPALSWTTVTESRTGSTCCNRYYVRIPQ